MDLNRLVSYSLRIGVSASLVLSILGLAAWAAKGYGEIQAASGPRIIPVLASAFQGNASGLIYLGVIVLIATPIFRVAVSSAYFADTRDRKYTLISLAVLSMLLFALFSGSVS